MKHTFIHDEDPARKMVPAMVAALVDGPIPEMRICLQCSVRGVARALRDMLDAAAEGDSPHGAALRAECLNILDETRPTVVAGPEDAQ